MAAVVSPLLFDEPSSPPPPPPAPATVDPSVAAASAAEVEAEAAAAARRRAVAQLRAGRAGTIATSARGILSPSRAAVQRRSLLGE